MFGPSVDRRGGDDRSKWVTSGDRPPSSHEGLVPEFDNTPTWPLGLSAIPPVVGRGVVTGNRYIKIIRVGVLSFSLGPYHNLISVEVSPFRLLGEKTLIHYRWVTKKRGKYWGSTLRSDFFFSFFFQIEFRLKHLLITSTLNTKSTVKRLLIKTIEPELIFSFFFVPGTI